MARRSGRGRLSSIDLLPEEAEPIVAWAMAELRERSRHQLDILDEFNRRLAALDPPQGPVSRSAFNRHALRLATTARRLEETRAIAATLTERLDASASDDLTIVVAETLKTLVFELLEDSKGIDTKGTMELARALQAAVSAQKISTERRQKIVDGIKAKIARAVDAVAGQVESGGETAPDGATVLKKIREDIYGIFDR